MSLVQINSKQRAQLELQSGISKRKEFSLIENFIRKHRNDIDTSLLYIQFQLNDSESGCSGPVCIASLGRFFIKFRKQSHQLRALDKNVLEFAAVHVVEEGSTLVVHFHKPPNVNLPYRIENHLRNASLTFYQKVLLLYLAYSQFHFILISYNYYLCQFSVDYCWRFIRIHQRESFWDLNLVLIMSGTI